MAADDQVTIGYVHRTQVSYSWHLSMRELIGYDLSNAGRVIRGGWLGVSGQDYSLPESRNKVVKDFLSQTDSPWLWWIDTDMGFAPDTVDRLLEAADPDTRPMVGALCFVARYTKGDGVGRVLGGAGSDDLRLVAQGETTGFLGRSRYPANSLVRCAGTGTGCVLVHRTVFEKVAAESGERWYDRLVNPSTGDLMGEDMSFCVRAGAVDIPIHVHTGVRTTHHKEQWLAEQAYWDWAEAPPATDRTAVIVPVLGRPQNAEPFMRTLRASTGLAAVYAVADDDDHETGQAWEDAGAEVIWWHGDPPGTFAQKVNVGFEATAEPWLFLCGDDVEFHPGWFDHAQAMASDSVSVVGTNDLGNPRVMAGEHATHLLIRRSYIDTHGASWDGPGVVCHEGYRHWFVDDEIVTVAKQRGVWAMALGSKVEHMHPYWDKAEDDDTYRLGQKHAADDGKLWRGRLKAYAS